MATPNPAEEAIKKIEAQLECPVCLQDFTDPKLLPCFHVFCKHCLEHILVCTKDQLNVCCPTCRRSIPLPPNGVSGLQSDFHVRHLFEIRDTLKKLQDPQKTKCEKCEANTATRFCHDCGQFICESCTQVHQLWKELKSHQVVAIGDVQAETASLIPSKRQDVHCPRHPGNVLKIYCETDGELICTDCTIRLHKDHQYDLVSDAFPKHREELLTSLGPIRQQVTVVNKALQAFEARANEISVQRIAIEADLNKRINSLIQTLQHRREELLRQLNQTTQQKLKHLAGQRDEIELLQTRHTSCLEHVEGSLKTGTQAEILAMKTSVVGQIRDLTAEFNPGKMLPLQEADLLLIADSMASLAKSCRTFAQVGLTVKSTLTHIEESNLKAVTVCKPTVVMLHCVAKDGKNSAIPIQDINAELAFCKDHTIIACDIRLGGEGLYEIAFSPARRGKHQLHVRIFGTNINGSPFPVLSLASLDTPAMIIKNVQSPRNVAVNGKGQILVAETGSCCVSVFTPEGKKLSTIKGGIGTPRGIAIDADDSILVADNTCHCVHKFTPEGTPVTSIGSPGSQKLQFSHLKGIRFGHNGKLYICEDTNHRVHILNRDLTFSGQFGMQGSKNGKLNNPTEVAFDSAGFVYVTDTYNRRIQVFNPDGKFVRLLGSKDHGTSQLQRPYGIAIDSNDIVYVTDWQDQHIYIFTTEGEFLNRYGGFGSAPGKFNDPQGITVSNSGQIVVADKGNNRVQIF